MSPAVNAGFSNLFLEETNPVQLNEKETKNLLVEQQRRKEIHWSPKISLTN